MADRQNHLEVSVRRIRDALETNRTKDSVGMFLDLHPGDQVEVFELLDAKEQELLLGGLDTTAIAALFSRQEDAVTLEAAEGMELERLADVLQEMEPDEAADLIGDLSPEQASEVLGQMEDLDDVLPLLGYPDETAGGRMTTSFIAMRRHTTSQQAIDFLRKVSPDNEVPYYIFVVDREKRLSGVVGLRELVVSLPEIRMEDIMNPDVLRVTAGTDQEEVAQLMTRYDLSALPVVDNDNELIGVITHDDILDVVAEEATEDIYRLASVGDSGLEPESPVREHLRGRLPWLYLNTLTALLAAWVISNFEEMIAQVAALAVFQSVVAGLGGNASSQTIALIVRALALGKVSPEKVWRVLAREFLVGLLQGTAVGVIAGIGVYLWRGNVYLGLVLGLALVANMVVAGFVGTIIPLGLKALNKDPAIASPVLVTAATDSFGFLIFLSLASYFVSKLQ
jgi:magnesium transporter